MKQIMWAGLLLTGLSGNALGTELQLTGGSIFIPDESFGLVSESSDLGSSGLRLVRPVAKPGLSATVGYELGTTSTSSWDYYYYDEQAAEDDSWVEDTPSAEPSLSLHTLSLGLQYQRDLLGWLSPYVGVGARAAVGKLTYDDNVAGWTMYDPNDPTGEEVLYTAEPTSDMGKSIGGEVHVGVAIRMPLGTASRAARKALADDTTTPTPAEAAGAPGEAAAAPAEAPAPKETTPAEAPRFYWGGFLEGGYQVATDLSFKESGSLDMGGSVARFGLLLQF